MGLLIPASRADIRRCSPVKLNTGQHSFRVFEEPLLRFDRLKIYLTPLLASPARRKTTCFAQSRCGKCTTGTETYFRGSDAGPDAGRSASEEVAQGHLEPDSAAGMNHYKPTGRYSSQNFRFCRECVWSERDDAHHGHQAVDTRHSSKRPGENF